MTDKNGELFIEEEKAEYNPVAAKAILGEGEFRFIGKRHGQSGIIFD